MKVLNEKKRKTLNNDSFFIADKMKLRRID